MACTTKGTGRVYKRTKKVLMPTSDQKSCFIRTRSDQIIFYMDNTAYPVFVLKRRHFYSKLKAETSFEGGGNNAFLCS